MRAFFVSDIHITSARDPLHERFLAFLDKCYQLKAEHLFLVGDIFDLWIADRDYFVSEYQAIIDQLKKLQTLGTQIHYFEGNHDLDLKLYWQHKLGFDVQEEAAYYKIGPLTVRVEHGDQMDPSDQGYLFLRWLLRTPLLRVLGRWLPNSIVKWIGARASGVSRDYTTQVKIASEDEVRNKIHTHAKKVLGIKPFHLFVSGHVHVPEDSSLEAGGNRVRCINLGTWLKDPKVLDVQESAIQLRSLEEFLQGK